MHIIIKPAKSTTKKYDVFENGKKLFSFGSSAHNHYDDSVSDTIIDGKKVVVHSKIKPMNHLDKKRRSNYWARHGGGATTKSEALNHIAKKYGKITASYFALKFLW